jgi:hypothetical protein
VHIALWRDGVKRACAFGRYPALLVSLHALTIYTRYFDFAKASAEDKAAVQSFLDEQHRFQRQVTASLRAGARTAVEASPRNIERNRMLIAALDRMSIAICRGIEAEADMPDVPMAEDYRADLRLRARNGEAGTYTVAPWPFRESSVTVRAEGKRLSGRYVSQEDLLRALEEAEAVLVSAVLHAV